MKAMKKITFILLSLFGTVAFAQTGVNVTYYDGTVQVFNVAETGKLYFGADNLYVQPDAATTPTTIPVTIIRKITFSDAALSTPSFGLNKSQLVLYPNPGSDVVRIKSESAEELKTKIYSLTGQLVLQGIYQPDQDIDVSKLASGLYLVQVNDLTIKFSKK